MFFFLSFFLYISYVGFFETIVYFLVESMYKDLMVGLNKINKYQLRCKSSEQIFSYFLILRCYVIM